MIAITDGRARVLTVDGGKLLPNGPLVPLHRSLQAGVRQWVEEQTKQPFRVYRADIYVCRLPTDAIKTAMATVYVGYMGLVQEATIQEAMVEEGVLGRGRVIAQILNPLLRPLALKAVPAGEIGMVYFPWENRLTTETNSAQITEKLKQWARRLPLASQKG